MVVVVYYDHFNLSTKVSVYHLFNKNRISCVFNLHQIKFVRLYDEISLIYDETPTPPPMSMLCIHDSPERGLIRA